MSIVSPATVTASGTMSLPLKFPIESLSINHNLVDSLGSTGSVEVLNSSSQYVAKVYLL